jgi:release factor glutamine methyltransferase
VSRAAVRNGTAGVSPAIADEKMRPGRPRSKYGRATIGSAIADAVSVLDEAGFDEPRRRARRLLTAALGLSDAEVFAHPERPLGEAEQTRIAAMLGRLLAHEPLTRILGSREFWGLEFSLSADTLDPRPETETVVEAVLARRPDRHRRYCILDLGTGSGCLLLALLSELPQAFGIGVDLAPGTAAAARRNAAALGLSGRAGFLAGSWDAAIRGPVDVILANPPYISSAAIDDLAPEVARYEPRRALDGGPDGLDAYRLLAPAVRRLLRPGGIGLVEIGERQAGAVTALMERAGLAVEEVRQDLAGIERCVVVALPSAASAAAESNQKNDWNADSSRLGWSARLKEP